MTLSALTTTPPQAIESISSATANGLTVGSGESSVLGNPIDLHHALAEVQKMREFQPPQPGLWEELLKQPIIRELGKNLADTLTEALQRLKQLPFQMGPANFANLPENIRDIFTGFIGFIIVLMSLYTFYIFLGWLLRLREAKPIKREPETRIFEQTKLINSKHHYSQAQEASKVGQYDKALYQLYLASLCLLDEKAMVPYQDTRSNLEYMQSLAQAARVGTASPSLEHTFERLARRFEAVRYGHQEINEGQFVQVHTDYQQLQESIPTHG